MRHKALLFKITLTLALLILPPLWLASTNSGLNTALKVAGWFAPGKVSIISTKGNLLAQSITLNHIEYAENAHILQIRQATVSWRTGKIVLKKVTGFENFFPVQELLAIGRKTTIELIEAELVIGSETKRLSVDLTGTWQQAALSAQIHATYSAENWTLGSSSVQIGNNSLSIKPLTDKKYHWLLNLPQPELLFRNGSGALRAEGEFSDLQNPDHFTTQITAKNFRFATYAVNNLQAQVNISRKPSDPLHIKITADQVLADKNILSNIKVYADGTFAKHSLNADVRYNNSPIHIHTLATVHKDLWATSHLKLKYENEILNGDAKINLRNMESALNLHGAPYNYKTKLSFALAANKDISAKLNLEANEHNQLNAVVKLQNNKLDGTIKLEARDLSLLMKWLPDVTRLKGVLKAEGKVYGTLEEPLISAQAHLTQITATLPALGVKIKPMELHLHSEGQNKLILSGSGKMRRGPGEFKISGYIEPFKPNFPHSILLIANQLEFIKNDNAQLIANTQLNFNFDHLQHQLNIKGHIDVLRGNIFFNSKKPNTVKSKDVVFVDHKAAIAKSEFRVHPDLNIWIYEGVHFSGFGLDADITGNLDVTQRHDALYGNGRVTIKQGTFKLPGQTLQIKKGRLLYPPGTLLVNPSLDIKMHGGAPIMSQDSSKDSNDLEIFVRGTAQAPAIYETDIANNKDKVLSQIMLTSSSLISKNLLQEKLKLTELGLRSNNEQMPDFFYNPGKQTTSLRDKDLVIGRPIGDKLYLQYLHSMGEKNKRVKLKYALNDVWSLGIDGGERGAGADLSFVVETD